MASYLKYKSSWRRRSLLKLVRAILRNIYRTHIIINVGISQSIPLNKPLSRSPSEIAVHNQHHDNENKANPRSHKHKQIKQKNYEIVNKISLVDTVTISARPVKVTTAIVRSRIGRTLIIKVVVRTGVISTRFRPHNLSANYQQNHDYCKSDRTAP